MDLTERLKQLNDRLKAACVGVAVEVQGDRVRLRATLPPKPGSDKLTAYQQRISLGYHANPAGLAMAEKEARKVGALLDCKQFSWEPYLPTVLPKGETVGEWISRFTEWRSQHDPVAPVTWQTDYSQPFNQLPGDAILTADLLVQVISQTKPNTRTRRRYCLAYQQLARFARIDLNTASLIGSYSAQKVNPRDIPDDSTILEIFTEIEHPGWRWVYGMIAAYGLRPHEAFFTDLDDFPVATVLRGKSGSRFVWPLWPEWPTLWGLDNPCLPDCAPGQEHSAYGERVGKFFRRENISFHAYDLRHAWAGRAVEFGLDVSLAAKQMGHSVKIHCETYQMWIDKAIQQRVYDGLVARRSLSQDISS
jgi:integrase